jgi:hypothetical protein
MKYFAMIGGIESDMMHKFIDFQNSNAAEEQTIILNTVGGDYWYAETIVKMINDRKNTTILIIQGVYSMGFFIAFRSECKKILSNTSRGMFHRSSISVQIDERNKPVYKEGKCIVKDLPLSKSISESIAALVMTDREFKKFMKGDDVYFGHRRMVKIFSDATVMKQ